MNNGGQNNTAKRPAQQRRGMMGGHGPGRGMMRGEKAQDFKGTMVKLLQYIGQYWIGLIVVAVLTVGSTVFVVIGPDILKGATNEIFNGLMAKVAGTGGIDFAKILDVVVRLLILYLASVLFSLVQGFIMTNITMNVTYKFRREISEKIDRLPLSFFDTTNHGEILSRITNDVDTVNQTLNQNLTQIITSVATLIGVLVMMFRINVWLTLTALVIVPIAMVLIMVVVSKSQKYFRDQQAQLGHVNGHVEEMYGAHSIVKIYNGEAQSIEQFNEHNNNLYNAAWHAQFLSGLMMPIMTIVGNLSFVAIVVLGGWLTARGSIQVGDILAFTQYVRQFNQPLAQIANISNTLQQTAAAAERVFLFLAREEEVPETAAPVGIDKSMVGEVEFRHVKFGYNPEKIIINDFNAMVTPGMRIAIVGPTGAGKTTIVKLLMRFYDVTEGAIFVDGHDLREFRRSDLRGMFGMVLQDTWLYNDTIRENIRYGRLDATDEEVVAAAKAAHVHPFVKTLPDGYDMVLNEDATNVSQGQKQLLTIARVILKNPSVLILDEATSSVDTRTEIDIQKAMLELMQSRTSFIIAHRLSTIRDADLILAMKDGDIAEMGTHRQLLDKNGFYASIYNAQFESGLAEMVEGA